MSECDPKGCPESVLADGRGQLRDARRAAAVGAHDGLRAGEIARNAIDVA